MGTISFGSYGNHYNFLRKTHFSRSGKKFGLLQSLLVRVVVHPNRNIPSVCCPSFPCRTACSFFLLSFGSSLISLFLQSNVGNHGDRLPSPPSTAQIQHSRRITCLSHSFTIHPAHMHLPPNTSYLLHRRKCQTTQHWDQCAYRLGQDDLNGAYIVLYGTDQGHS